MSDKEVIYRSRIFADRLFAYAIREGGPEEISSWWPAKTSTRVTVTESELAAVECLTKLSIHDALPGRSLSQSLEETISQVQQLVFACLRLEETLQWSRNQFWQIVLLDALAPVVCANRETTWTQQIEDSRKLLMHAISLQYLVRFINEPEMSAWLQNSTTRDTTPKDAILRSFDLDIDEIAFRFWDLILNEEIFEDSNRELTKSIKPLQSGSAQRWCYCFDIVSQEKAILVSNDRCGLNKEQTIDQATLETGQNSSDRWAEAYKHFSAFKELCFEAVRSRKQALKPAGPLYPETPSNVAASDHNLGAPQNQTHSNASFEAEDSSAMLAGGSNIFGQHAAGEAQLLSQLSHLIYSVSGAGHPLAIGVIKSRGKLSEPALSVLQHQSNRDLTSTEWIQLAAQFLIENFEDCQCTYDKSDPDELIVFIQRFDRQEGASLLREIISFLVSNSIQEQHPNLRDLSFFGGLALTTNPSTNTDAKQLIESARRCLRAAEDQGPSSVKSIEVF